MSVSRSQTGQNNWGPSRTRFSRSSPLACQGFSPKADITGPPISNFWLSRVFHGYPMARQHLLPEGRDASCGLLPPPRGRIQVGGDICHARCPQVTPTRPSSPSLSLHHIVDRYTVKSMIKTFRNQDAQALFEGRCPRRWQAIRQAAERKLALLHAAATLDFLRSSPGNRLEALKGDRIGQWSIRINDQW